MRQPFDPMLAEIGQGSSALRVSRLATPAFGLQRTVKVEATATLAETP